MRSLEGKNLLSIVKLRPLVLASIVLRNIIHAASTCGEGQRARQNEAGRRKNTLGLLAFVYKSWFYARLE